MKNDNTNYQINEAKNQNIVAKIVRPQRKRLSRYKLKKQTSIIEEILQDPFITQM